jgi:hypothetical protein
MSSSRYRNYSNSKLITLYKQQSADYARRKMAGIPMIKSQEETFQAIVREMNRRHLSLL